MPRTEPVTDRELAERRRDTLPDSLSEEVSRRKSLTRVRKELSELALDNIKYVQEWLDITSVLDGPKAALELYLKLLEFSVPKLSRAEITVENPDADDDVARLTIADLQQLRRDGVALEARTVDGECERVDSD